MSELLIKTNSWPKGRAWPSVLYLDVGSNMPFDIHATRENGAEYARMDIIITAVDALNEIIKTNSRCHATQVAKQTIKELKAALAAKGEK